MSQQRIALVGAGGQLASDLLLQLSGVVIPLAHADLEITDREQVEAALDAVQPDVVINAAAYNLVDQAEDEPAKAFAVNAFGARHLARYCGRRGLTFLQVSTDYVFGGDLKRTDPLNEEDCPLPVNVYGASKLAGEHFVRSECEKHFIVRTCGLYGLTPTRTKSNFVETMLRLATTRPELRVVDDQHCTPTLTVDVARAMAALLRTEKYGVYQATNTGSTTWCRMAAEVFRLTDQETAVIPVSSQEFVTKARRPAYSVLTSQKLSDATGFQMPAWTDAIARYLAMRAESTRSEKDRNV